MNRFRQFCSSCASRGKTPAVGTMQEVKPALWRCWICGHEVSPTTLQRPAQRGPAPRSAPAHSPSGGPATIEIKVKPLLDTRIKVSPEFLAVLEDEEGMNKLLGAKAILDLRDEFEDLDRKMTATPWPQPEGGGE